MEEMAAAAIGGVTFGISIIILWWVRIWGKGPFAALGSSSDSFKLSLYGPIEKTSQRSWILATPFFGMAFILASLSYLVDPKWLFIEFSMCLFLGLIGFIWAAITSLPIPKFLRPHQRLSLVLEQRSAALLSTPLPLTLRAPRTYWPFGVTIAISVLAFAAENGGAPTLVRLSLWGFGVLAVILGVFMLAYPETLVIGYEGLRYKGMGGEFFVRWSRLDSAEVTSLYLKLDGNPDTGRFRELVPSRFLVDGEALYEVILKAKQASLHN